MLKLIAAAMAAGVLGAGMTFAPPAAAAPNCSAIAKQVHDEGYKPTTSEKWACAGPIEADKWTGFPERIAKKWTDFPKNLKDKWTGGGGE